MTDDSGDWTSVRDYYPFGEERIHDTQGDDAVNRFDYGNKERDESGLSYFEARYLSTGYATFTTLDPVFLAANSEEWIIDPQAQNSYGYARNNPVILIDPTGLWNAKTGEVEDGDTLSKITGYINEIYGTNYNYNQIAALNGIEDPNSISIGQVITPNAYEPDITVDMFQKMEAHANEPGIQFGVPFAWLSAKEGQWDLKSQPGLYCQRASCGGQTHDSFIFLGERVEGDAPANIHYGYVGNSAWYGFKPVLQVFSSLANMVDNKTAVREQRKDKVNINWGIQLRKNNR